MLDEIQRKKSSGLEITPSDYHQLVQEGELSKADMQKSNEAQNASQLLSDTTKTEQDGSNDRLEDLTDNHDKTESNRRTSECKSVDNLEQKAQEKIEITTPYQVDENANDVSSDTGNDGADQADDQEEEKTEEEKAMEVINAISRICMWGHEGCTIKSHFK